MAIEAFRTINFKRATLSLIETCNEVIDRYQAQGYKLTLRQLYYQLVATDVIPNRQTEYDRLGSIVNDARLAGYIDWDAIEDRTRSLRGVAHTESPERMIENTVWKYWRDKWEDQDNRIEVWIEKDALAGVFSRVCAKLDIDYFSCRGYTSQTAMYDAAKRHAGYIEEGQTPIILHFGDHDPSGIDMTRDIRERLEMFNYGEVIEVDRLALNMDQVRKFNPPPNPAKITDSRYGAYTRIYGFESWELDALEPNVLAGLVEDAVKQFRDEDKWQAAVKREQEEKDSLRAISRNYSDVIEYLDGKEQDEEDE